MKRLFLLMIPLLLLLCACGREQETIRVLTQWEETDYAEDGSVSSVTTKLYTYDQRGNNTQIQELHNGNQRYTSHCFYDRHGNQTWKLVVQNSGSVTDVSSLERMKYDKNGNLTLHVNYTGWLDRERTSYSYDENGALVRMENISKYGSTYVEEYIYEETDSQRTFITRNSLFNSHEDKEIEFFDDQGVLCRKELYFSGILKVIVEYTYDDQGRLSIFSEYDGTGTLQNVWKYRYDEEANSVTTIYYDDDYRIEYYDDQGNVLCKESYDSDGTLRTRITYTYEEITVPIQ